MKNTFLLILFAFSLTNSFAQKLTLKKFGIGVKVFEPVSINDDPFSVSRFLKNPLPYLQLHKDLKATEFNAGSSYISFYTYYNVQAEFVVNNPQSRFWKKNSIQAGIFLSNQINERIGSWSKSEEPIQNDTSFKRFRLNVETAERYAGIFLGITKRIRINKNLGFHYGVRGQGFIASTSKYIMKLDTFYVVRSNQIKLASNNDIVYKGLHFFQWQFQVPIGLIYDFFDHRYAVRLDLIPGLLGGRYSDKSTIYGSAHGAGLTLLRTL